MALTIEQKTLAEIIGFAAKVNVRSTIPIVECVKISFGAGGLSVEATDMEKWIRISTPDFKAKGAEVAIVPCKQLHTLISGIDKAEKLTLSLTEKRFIVKTKNSKYQFGLFPVEEWPTFEWKEKTKSFKVNAKEFVEILRFVLPSCSVDDVRHYLHGVYLREGGKDKLRFAACDGHQLSHALMKIPGGFELPKEGVILPSETMQLYTELLQDADGEETATLEISESKARLEFSGNNEIMLTGRLIDGTFPDIDKVVPYQRVNERSILDRAETVAALRRIIPMTLTKEGGPVKIEFMGDTAKFTGKTEHSDGEETVGHEGGKHKCAVTLSLSKFLSVMSAFDCEKVTLMLDPAGAPEKEPVIFADAGDKVSPQTKRFSIIMPMRG